MESNVTVLKKEDLDACLGSFKSEIKSDIEASKPDLSGMVTMEDIQKMFEVSKPDPEVKEETTDVAEHERSMGGVLGQALNFEVAGIEVGKAALGGFAAIFTTELIDGFMTGSSVNTKGLTKIGIGWAMVAFVSRWLGKSFTVATALFLTFDGLRDLTPMNEWAASLADKITGQTPAAGLRGQTTPSVISQANQVANSYGSILKREG